jgi:SNF2 family DNA or RNA helicase
MKRPHVERRLERLERLERPVDIDLVNDDVSGDDIIVLKDPTPTKKKTDSLDQCRQYMSRDLKLRTYQEQGVRWLLRRNEDPIVPGGILADEMGVGKTIQTIVMIGSFPIGSSTMIICPLALLAQWCSEIKKFSKFNPVMYYGPDRHKQVLSQLKLDTQNVIITTYGVIVQDDKTNQRNGGLMSTLMFNRIWECIVIDEGHEIRTTKTKKNKSVLKLKARRKWVLTGTPIHNSAKDFMSLLIFLGVSEDSLKEIKKKLGYRLHRKEGLRMLKELSQKYMLRREKAYLPSLCLPKKKQWILELTLEDAEYEIYNALHTQCSLEFNTFMQKGTVLDNYAYILVLINKLRRAACHPYLGITREDRDDPEKHISGSAMETKASTKMIAILKDIYNYHTNEHRKVVLFSQWTDFINLLEPFLVQLKVPFVRYDGKMNMQQRNTSLIEFKTNPDIGVILVSLKAGGQGLNLCEGSVAMFADHWWNSAAEDQATDRIHRIGQTRSVDIIKYTTKGTIEEDVLKLQAKKRVHEQALLGSEKTLTRLKIEDLKLMFKLPEVKSNNNNNNSEIIIIK